MASQLVKGNSAVIIGAMHAGCECFFGYPITPASEILHDAAQYFPAAGRQFVQAESEEAAVNMLYGAASAGARAMTASSGLGISLKQEGFSYMAGAELPAVIVDIMRAGPGLGNIGPEQSDYNQIVKGGGHGSYQVIVLAPASVQEMCDFTFDAFSLAARYRTPVVVLADGVLGQMIESLCLPEQSVTPAADTAWAVTGAAATRDNVITSIYLDFDQLERHNQKLQDKYAQITAAEVRCEEWRTGDAEIILVAYGISARVARSAAEQARAAGKRVGLLRPQTLFPFPTTRLRVLAETADKFFSVEMSNGQMQADIRLAIECAKPVGLISRMGGNMISAPEILSQL